MSLQPSTLQVIITPEYITRRPVCTGENRAENVLIDVPACTYLSNSNLCFEDAARHFVRFVFIGAFGSCDVLSQYQLYATFAPQHKQYMSGPLLDSSFTPPLTP